MFDFNDLEFIKKIGCGSYGTVNLVKKKTDGHLYALKLLNIQSDEIFENKAFLRESHIMQSLNYSSIVKFYGINLYDNNDPSIFNPSILLEYLPNGSLKKTLDKWRNSHSVEYWTPTCRYKAILGIAYGMKYLHKNKIIHRDLKPDNILFDEQYEVCICDFGLSRYVSNSGNLEITKYTGSPLYMAPENFDLDHDTYNEPVDVYSFSYIVYEIITGKKLFITTGENIQTFLKKILDGRRPNLNDGSISEKMKDLLTKCWDADPENRLTFEEICNILSNDFSYFTEDVDENEIKNYISKLEEQDKNEIFQISLDKYSKTMLKFLQVVIEKMDNFNEMKIENILKNYFYGNPLHYACKLGNFDLVKFFICNLNFDLHSKTV